jgi:hypothetical protein
MRAPVVATADDRAVDISKFEPDLTDAGAILEKGVSDRAHRQ